MSKLFSLDSPVMNFLSNLADMILLNIVYLICCIPIVTIGAATTALYTVTLKMVRKEYPAILKSFFTAFRKNLKTSTLCWIPMIVAAIILFLDYRLLGALPGTLQSVIRIALSIIALLYLMILLYLFPYIARFDNNVKNTFKNTILISIMNLPLTLLMLVANITLIIVSLLTFQTMIIALSAAILFTFSVLAYLQSILFTRIFKKYEPEETESTEEPQST